MTVSESRWVIYTVAEDGTVTIFGTESGKPFFSSDSAQLKADIILDQYDVVQVMFIAGWAV